MNIQIKKIVEEDITSQSIHLWPIWSCPVSEFDWEYAEEEVCYLLEGEVQIQTEFETVMLSPGDFVIFPKGLKCRWKVTSPVRKHYSFR